MALVCDDRVAGGHSIRSPVLRFSCASGSLVVVCFVNTGSWIPPAGSNLIGDVAWAARFVMGLPSLPLPRYVGRAAEFESSCCTSPGRGTAVSSGLRGNGGPNCQWLSPGHSRRSTGFMASFMSYCLHKCCKILLDSTARPHRPAAGLNGLASVPVKLVPGPLLLCPRTSKRRELEPAPGAEWLAPHSYQAHPGIQRADTGPSLFFFSLQV